MHAATRASSSRAGTIAVTEPGIAAGMAVPMGGTWWASLGIVYSMRKDRFPFRGGWGCIAFDENPSKNCGLGRSGGWAGGFSALCAAALPPRRGLDCWEDSGGLYAANHPEAPGTHPPSRPGALSAILGR